MSQVLLISGGLASRLVAQQSAGAVALFVNFGQVSADWERHYAKRAATAAGVEFVEVDVRSLGLLMSGPVVSRHLRPPNAPWEHPSNSRVLPESMFAVLILCAVAQAARSGADEVVLGVTADMLGRSRELVPGSLDLLVEVLSFGAVSLKMPLIDDSLAGVEGLRDPGAATQTVSCFRALPKHCGICAKCRARRDAFREAGVFDATLYLDEPEQVEVEGDEVEIVDISDVGSLRVELGEDVGQNDDPLD